MPHTHTKKHICMAPHSSLNWLSRDLRHHSACIYALTMLKHVWAMLLSSKWEGSGIRTKNLANCKTWWGSRFVMICSAFMFLKDNSYWHTTPHTCLKNVFICFQYRQPLSWVLAQIQKRLTYPASMKPIFPIFWLYRFFCFTYFF